METQNQIVLGVFVLAIFVFIIGSISLYVQTKISSGDVCECVIPLFIPFVGSIGLFIGTVIYYFFTNTHNSINKDLFLIGFMPKESHVVNKLLENGKTTQSKIVRESNMNKVQVFRVLERLQNKNIIKKVPHGRTNMIEFTDNVKKKINL